MSTEPRKGDKVRSNKGYPHIPHGTVLTVAGTQVYLDEPFLRFVEVPGWYFAVHFQEVAPRG